MKRCPDCKIEKNESEFYTIAGGKLYSYCKPCTRIKAIKTRNNRIDAAREYNREWRKRNPCKQSEANRRWRQSHRAWYLARQKEYRKRMLAKDKNWDKRKAINASYGITLEKYYSMVEAQNHRCALCNRSCKSGRQLSIDHNHKTGKIRELLCGNCNVGLGNFQDDPEILQKAVAYLQKHS